MKVFILGAGPAGASCAIELCKIGIEIVLVDVSSFPRFTPGESCHPGIEPLLIQLGVMEKIITSNPFRFDGIWINKNGELRKEFFNESENWQGFHFNRELFDTILLDEAIRLGTKFIPNIKAIDYEVKSNAITKIKSNLGIFAADFFIDATGRKCWSAQRLNIGRKVLSDKIYSWYCRIKTDEIVDQKYEAYYEQNDNYQGFIAKIGKNEHSITVITKKKNDSDLNNFLEIHFPKGITKTLSKGFETNWSIINEHPIKNLFFVGDSLFQLDPTSSKGILKSIMSGMMVANILEGMKEGKMNDMEVKKVYYDWANGFFELESRELTNLNH